MKHILVVAILLVAATAGAQAERKQLKDWTSADSQACHAKRQEVNCSGPNDADEYWCWCNPDDFGEPGRPRAAIPDAHDDDEYPAPKLAPKIFYDCMARPYDQDCMKRLAIGSSSPKTAEDCPANCGCEYEEGRIVSSVCAGTVGVDLPDAPACDVGRLVELAEWHATTPFPSLQEYQDSAREACKVVGLSLLGCHNQEITMIGWWKEEAEKHEAKRTQLLAILKQCREALN